MKQFLRRQLLKNRDMLLHEGKQINDFMTLLMKKRNGGNRWTRAEKHLLRAHLKRLSFYVPVLIIFSMPLGSLLIPVLAEVLDRRKTGRS